MVGQMLILSAGLSLFILLGVAGRWRVDHVKQNRKGARLPPGPGNHPGRPGGE